MKQFDQRLHPAGDWLKYPQRKLIVHHLKANTHARWKQTLEGTVLLVRRRTGPTVGAGGRNELCAQALLISNNRRLFQRLRGNLFLFLAFPSHVTIVFSSIISVNTPRFLHMLTPHAHYACLLGRVTCHLWRVVIAVACFLKFSICVLYGMQRIVIQQENHQEVNQAWYTWFRTGRNWSYPWKWRIVIGRCALLFTRHVCTSRSWRQAWEINIQRGYFYLVCSLKVALFGESHEALLPDVVLGRL